MGVAIDLKKVTKRFGGLVAVHDVDMQLQDGEILGMIGPNGAGKSTLFNLITNIERPDSGTILIRGKDHRKLTPAQICRLNVGRTFQIVKPFGNITVLQNVMIGAFSHLTSEAKAKEHALEILEFVGLLEKSNALGYDLPLASLKRLELARALATKPKILLLDEVMAGLNPTEIEKLMVLIKKINEMSVTLFIIEHVMKAIMSISDRIVVLHNGEKIGEGVPKEIASDEKVIKAYLGEEYEIN